MATVTMNQTVTTMNEKTKQQSDSEDNTSSTSSSHIPRGPVTATLKFFAAPTDKSKPFNYPLGTEPPAGLPRRNFGDADIAVAITDIRGHESEYTTDTNGFTTLGRASLSSTVDFKSEDSIKETYYREIESTLHSVFPAASHVVAFDHTVRPSGGTRPPVLRTHIDQSPSAAMGRAKAFLPSSTTEEEDLLLKGRVRIINVWRPLNGPVQSFPLAFADSVTVRDDELYVVEHRYAERTGETLSLAHGDEKWLYWSGMMNDERLLIQIFDSEMGARLAHTAFEDPRTPVGARERESIEVRALVFG